mmetsp:Transcript_14753/g.36845  ORF Transcript_14753/g.36845 Transcript_14753/m.36845 type:complete len:87 (+) Transcript_14753:102-362(+)
MNGSERFRRSLYTAPRGANEACAQCSTNSTLSSSCALLGSRAYMCLQLFLLCVAQALQDTQCILDRETILHTHTRVLVFDNSKEVG